MSQGSGKSEFPAPALNGDTAMQKKDYAYTGYQYKTVENARKLRKNMTKQERRLRHDFLRPYPVQFYRQQAIDRFIVDFYCAKARFVIELDGSQQLHGGRNRVRQTAHGNLGEISSGSIEIHKS